MIDRWLNRVDQINPKILFGVIVANSILLAAWMQYIQHGWINPDSLIYFEQARLFSLGHLESMLDVYQWPLYGICIGIVYKYTSLEIHTSAQLLNMLFFGLATASFLKIIKLAGGSNRTLFVGALLLFSSLYIVGDVLEMLMRDEGFWAFYLTALVFFIRYNQSQNVSDALLWQVFIVIATLFRIEAILFMLLLPLIYLLEQGTTPKLKSQKILNSYSIIMFIGTLIFITILMQPQFSMHQIGRLNEVFTSNLFEELTQKFLTQAHIMSSQVLGRYLDEFAIPGLILTFIYVLCSKTITATGLVGTTLALICLKSSSDCGMKQATKNILITVCCIAIIAMGLIIVKVFILSSRYAIALALILLIFASFQLSALSLSNNKKIRMLFVSVCVILCLCFIKNIAPKREGYNYMKDAAVWINKHNPNNFPVFYDDTRVLYYANLVYKRNWGDGWQETLIAINNQSIQNNKFIVLTHSMKKHERINFIKKRIPNYVEVKRFNNPGAKKFIVIYQKQY